MSQQWKIDRDYFYADLYERWGFDFIEEAGFFYDTDLINRNINDSLDLLCTSLGFEVDPSKKSCVLLTTGSFCPIHYGHIEMMNNAKNALEEQGWDVLSGYIAPAHDEYIHRKCGRQSISIDKRIQLIQREIADSDWLVIDSWEGVFNKVAVNFTDVIARLQLYIERHIQKTIPVFYVCGSDNARFAKTFTLKGYCVVVNRPGYENQYSTYQYLSSERIIFVQGNAPVSSTEIRQVHSFEPKKISLDLITQEHPLESHLIDLIGSYYAGVKPYLLNEYINVTSNNQQTISLDDVICADYSFSVSRLYDLGGTFFKRFIARPGYASFARQLQLIPKGEYALWDTDSFSGKTLAFITDLLKQYEVVPVITQTLLKQNNNEILDAKDFFLNAKDAGLVVQLPNGEITRAPYIYPYVNPAVRCSIEKGLRFSIDIWQMNRDYFKTTNVRLGELNTNKALFLYLGFSESDLLSDIADWHYQKLIAYYIDA